MGSRPAGALTERRYDARSALGRSGGIGRRDGLKHRSLQEGSGSSPDSGTKLDETGRVR